MYAMSELPMPCTVSWSADVAQLLHVGLAVLLLLYDMVHISSPQSCLLALMEA